MTKPTPLFKNQYQRDDTIEKLARHLYNEGFDPYPLDQDRIPMWKWQTDGRIELKDYPKAFRQLHPPKPGSDEEARACVGIACRNDTMIDVDFDWPEAVPFGDLFLAPTRIFGRSKNPKSHYVYKATGAEITSRKFKTTGKADRNVIIELRASAGTLTTCPPSNHPSGDRYDWHKNHEGKLVAFRKCPPDIEDRVAKIAACAIVNRRYGHGNRDDLVTAFIRVASEHMGLDAEMIEDVIDAICDYHGDDPRDFINKVRPKLEKMALGEGNHPGLPSLCSIIADHADVFREAIGIDSPAQIGPPRDFLSGYDVPPLPGCVPSILIDRARDIAERVGAPVECALFPMMVQGFWAAGDGIRVELRCHGGWLQPPILFSFVAVRSGSRKSPALAKAVERLTVAEREADNVFKLLLQQYDDELEAWKNADRGDRGPRPTPPVRVKHKIADSTIEALISVHDSNPRGLMIVQDELSLMLLNSGKYTGGRSTDEAQWCSMYDAGEINKIRVGQQGSFYRSTSCVNIVGMIQPGVLPKLITEGNKLLGLCSRFNLSAIPQLPDVPDHVIDRPRNEIAKKAYDDRIAKLREWFDLPAEHAAIFKLDRAAQGRFDTECLRYQKLARDLPEPFATHIEKYPGLLGRIALNFHIFTFDTKLVTESEAGMYDFSRVKKISRETVEAAISFLDYLFAHAQVIYRTTDQRGGEKEGRALAKLLLDADEPIVALNYGDVLDRDRADLKNRDQIAAAFEFLAAFDWGIYHSEYKPKGGGRPTMRFVVNPRIYDMDPENSAWSP